MVETTNPSFHPELSRLIVGCAIAVHRELGPGLLESAYRACLLHELARVGLQVESEVPLPITFRGMQVDCGYRVDIVVEGSVLLELKAVERLLPVHEAQLLTYLKLSGLRVGYLMNFNARTLLEGLRRLVR